MKKTSKAGLIDQIGLIVLGVVLWIVALFEFEVRYGQLLFNDFWIYIGLGSVLMALGTITRAALSVKAQLENKDKEIQQYITQYSGGYGYIVAIDNR